MSEGVQNLSRSVSNVENVIKNKEENSNKQVDYDELLSAAGEFGRYQVFLLFSTFPFYFFGVYAYFSQIFMTEISPNFWCWIPELSNLSEFQRRSLAIPPDPEAQFGYSHCKAYVANWTDILDTNQTLSDSWETQSCQHGWEFNKSEIPYPTITSELGWVCDKNSYQATAQSVFFLGSMVGGLIIGWVADKYGRLPAATLSNIIGCVAGIASIFATDLVQFSICRFLMGMCYDNCMMMTYLLVLEYVAPKYRSISANLPFGIFFCLAATTLPWIALACGHWKTISLVTSIPMAIAIFAPIIIPESPRWLLSKGRINDAVDKVVTIGKINKNEVPSQLIEQFKISNLNKRKDDNANILYIFKRPKLRTMFICLCFEYMCCTAIFDVLVRSLGSLEFDFFVSFTLVSLTELPSLVLISFSLDITGRKGMSLLAFLICIIFSILTAFLNGLPSVLCAIVARFAINMSYNTVIQWSAEMLPTPVRGSGASIVHISGYIGTIISPYIVFLKNFMISLPLLITAIISLIGLSLAMTLPETALREMPQTFDDTEELISNQKLIDIPMFRKKNRNKCDDNYGTINTTFEME